MYHCIWQCELWTQLSTFQTLSPQRHFLFLLILSMTDDDLDSSGMAEAPSLPKWNKLGRKKSFADLCLFIGHSFFFLLFPQSLQILHSGLTIIKLFFMKYCANIPSTYKYLDEIVQSISYLIDEKVFLMNHLLKPL